MQVAVDTQADVKTDSGENDIFAHYAEKNEITEALVTGVPIIALCGKIWVPSRDPSKYQVCPSCKDLYNALFLSD
jgi:hypothetical protein